MGEMEKWGKMKYNEKNEKVEKNEFKLKMGKIKEKWKNEKRGKNKKGKIKKEK